MTRYRALLLAVVMGFTCAFAASADEVEPRKRVLFLSSYHPGFPTFFSQVNGLRKGLAEKGFDEKNLILDIEFLDAKRFAPALQVPMAATILARKFANFPPYDLVITGDDHAFKLAVARQDDLFRGSPVVFLGVNDAKAGLAQNANPRVTGVVEHYSVMETLQMMQRLYPMSGHAVIVSDATEIGDIGAANVRKAAAKMRYSNLEYYSLGEHTFEDLYDHLGELNRDTPVLLLTHYRDMMGTVMQTSDLLAHIRRVYKGALFGAQRHGLGFGLFGGKLVDHESQGLVAGRLGGRILTGEPIASIPVVGESPNVLMADFAEAQRLGFQKRDFHRDTRFINMPKSLLESHGSIITTALVISALQMGIIVVLILNVRRRREAEMAANRSRSEADLANKAKTEFLANMSHELRTPLNSVIGFSDVLIADRVGAINDEKRKEYMHDIRESGIYLLNLLNNILDVSKIEMGRLEISDSDIDVSQALNLCHRLVQERVEASGVHLSLHVPENIPGLHADPTRLKQSLLNLLSNAIKFSEPGDSVTTSAMIDSDGNMRISVTDTGPGISEDEINWVREPFNRGRSSRVAAKEGSGIGLALTASLMESHDGHLDLDSTLGVGTRATLVFPARRVVARRQPRAKIA